MLAFFSKISRSLCLWHWPLFTLTPFSKVSLTLDGVDEALLFAATIAISALSWRYIEQPFRQLALAKTRRHAFRLAGATSLLLVVGNLLGQLGGRAPITANPVAAKIDIYSYGEYAHLYNFGTCFDPAGGVFAKSCLALASDKTNVLLWGDSLAAHYILGFKAAADPDLFKKEHGPISFVICRRLLTAVLYWRAVRVAPKPTPACSQGRSKGLLC